MRRALWFILNASVWALAFGIAGWNLTVPAAGWAAVSGCVAGIFLAKRLAASRLRLAAIWGLALPAGALAVALTWLLRQSSLAAATLGPSAAFTLSEMGRWFLLALLIVGVLQASTRRVPAFLALEIGAVGAVFAGLFAAHREGFVNRPYFLVDPLWSRGYDPVPYFLAIGAAAVVLIVFLAAGRSEHRRSFLDVGLLGALILAILIFFPLNRIREMSPEYGGGSGEDSQERGRKSGVKKSPEQGKSQPRQGSDAAGAGAGRQSAPGQSAGAARGSSGQGTSGGAAQAREVLESFANMKAQPGNAPVAVVLLHDDYDPPAGYFYLRQTAFSQFNGVRLIQDTSGKADRDLADVFPTSLLRLPRWPVDHKIVRVLNTTVALMAPHPRPFALANPEVIEPVPNPDPTRFQRAYRVSSLVMAKDLGAFAGLPMGAKAWDQALREHYTGRPSDPRYQELSGKAVLQLKPEYRDDPFARAAAIKFWLEKNSTYSLDSDHEKAADPVADFLFGDRIGHCVYFAHSACLLFRTQGIASRVGAGYAVNARNRGGGSALMVREKDAHAWPEIYLEGAGWVVLDISPEKSLAPPEEAPDQGLQQMLGEMARPDAGNPRQEQKPAGRGDLLQALRELLKAAAYAALLALALWVLLLYGIKVRRRLAPRFCAEPGLPRLAYRACLDRLADAGILRSYGQTREAFARAGASPAFDRITNLHLQAALGQSPPAAGRREYLGLSAAAHKEMAGKISRMRRFIGLANPASWLKVK